ncbi:MAG TPA: FAD-linked oxidase C-terminal domain-containing protein [Burkholderiales bacterium]|jgi:FAD/FMN-containing dehydrogenase/Fe-S oxidoreductase|nr:FAD-linked oxidase C-terminal domain-containing protein [Burkholderiales bacterium]
MDELQAALKRAVRGEVRFDAGARAAYASDASNYRQVPIGVVLPKSAEDIVATVAACREHGAPILARGGGTSLCGQTVNVAVVIDASKYLDRVLEIDAAARTARVQPGVVCDALRGAAERYGLTFAPDPATHSRCTLGGMIGNNSCGPHSVMAGKTVENVAALEVLTYDGARFWCGPTSETELDAIIRRGGRQAEIYEKLRSLRDRYADLIRTRFPKIRRRVSGYNLDQLLPENSFNVARALVGSEGTCALTLQALTRLVPSPRERVLLVVGFPDIYAAGDAVPRVIEAGPIACEGLDEGIIGGLRERNLRLDDIARLPEGNAWLMVEFGADRKEEAIEKAERLRSVLGGNLLKDKGPMERIWTIRETGASATALKLKGTAGPDPVVGWEDAAVDPLRLGDYLRAFQKLVDAFGYRTSLYGHFGDGCIHARINFDLRRPAGVAHWRKFLEQAAALVVEFDGSLSGEHGDGQAKAELLPIMYGPELMAAFREFKRIWDPLGRMNPGKLVDALGEVNRVDANLRAGPEYRPVTLETRLSFMSDVGDGFTRAVERCVGMGKCRSQQGATMCPSYRATKEERYSTRGRARLLGEMLRGEVIQDGWQSEDVREALEWCLACKGCRSDCPTHTDMAAYKAEFLSHYYEGRARPVQAHLMGRISEWAGRAAEAPALVNALSGLPVLSGLVKRTVGIAASRRLPRFARRTFSAQFEAMQLRRRDPARTGGARRGDPAILFPDTFTNYFRPETGLAAVKVLETAGFRPDLPRERLCCGRPYYDFGMLERARRSIEQLLRVLAPQIESGVPIVVLEPGCLSVFRDEMAKILPQNAAAARLAKQAVSLAEALDARGWKPPRAAPIAGRALVHGHCHQKALGGLRPDLELLAAAGIEASAPDTGCCGMAGSFGFRAETYEASLKIAGLSVLPAVRAAPADSMIIANGFSCREQIEGLSGRTTRHLAEVLANTLP